MVEVDPHDAHGFGEHDADATVAGPAGLLAGLFKCQPGGWVGILGRASLAVMGDLVDAARRARTGLEREPDSLCLQAGGNPAVLAGCFRCGDRRVCVVDRVLTAGVAAGPRLRSV